MIGEEIRRALAKKRWSIARAAKESGVERTFLSRLVNGFPPPRVKKGRQTAEVDPRYRKLAETLGIADPDAFVQEVIVAQANSSPSEDLSEQQKRFLAHLWGQIDVAPKYKADISALLTSCVRAAGSPYGTHKLRRRFFETFKAQHSIPADSSSSESSFIGPDVSERADLDELSKLLDIIGDQVYTVQGECAIAAQFEIAQLLFELSRRVLTEPQALQKAVDLAREIDQPKLKEA